MSRPSCAYRIGDIDGLVLGVPGIEQHVDGEGVLVCVRFQGALPVPTLVQLGHDELDLQVEDNQK